MQCIQQLALAQCGVKLPFGPGRGVQGPATSTRPCAGILAQAFETIFKCLCGVGAVSQFAGAHARHPVAHLVGRAFGQVQHALGDAEPGQAAAVARALVHSHQDGFGFFAEQLGVHQCAGCHHAHHLALYRALAGDLAHLFTNGDRFAVANQFGQVALHRVEGNTSHDYRLTGGLAALRQRDVQQAGGFFSIGVKHLIEITHAVEEQGVGVVSLEPEVLLHHRRVRLVVFVHSLKSINSEPRPGSTTVSTGTNRCYACKRI